MAKKVRIYAGFPALFFSFKEIKKPSPVGEGGPRQWWMRSSREKLTLYRHLIRQPSAATFSHWRRLSFVSALLANKYKPAFKQGKGIWVAGVVYRCGGAVHGLVRSTIGDLDLRSPCGFDSGLRPPLRMTRRGGKVGRRGVVHGTFFSE